MLDTIKSFISKHQATIVALVAVAGLSVAMIACQPSVTSPITGRKVTESQLVGEYGVAKAQLEAEAAILTAKANALASDTQAAIDDIERQKAMWQAAIDTLPTLIGGALGPYGGLLTVGLGILATGVGVDNRRKDGVIQGQKMTLNRLSNATIVEK